MPMAPKRSCSYPAGCPALIEYGQGNRCPLHKKTTETRTRGTTAERGYGKDWERVRRWFLSQPENVMCADCLEAAKLARSNHRPEPRIEVSSEVHHIKKVCDYPELRLTYSNLRGLCKPHHQSRTARGQ